MKKYLLMAAVLVSGSTYAAQTTESDLSQSTFSNLKVHQGLRVSAGVGSRDYDLKTTLTIGSESGSDTVSESGTSQSLSLGYENINIQRIGFMTELFYTQLDYGDGEISNLGLEISATYGFTDQLYIYGGLNIANLDGSGKFGEYSKELFENVEFDTGLGAQLALGYKITNNLSAELKFKGINNSASYTGYMGNYPVDVDFTLSSSTIGASIIGTF